MSPHQANFVAQFPTAPTEDFDLFMEGRGKKAAVGRECSGSQIEVACDEGAVFFAPDIINK
jgi:hypothetical protein